MLMNNRLRIALKASLAHLLISLLIALLCAILIFGVWYPHPLDQLAKGRDLFILIIMIDVICGPLLTLVVFDKSKPTSELWRDLSLIGVIQIFALCYGIFSLANARPVWVAFEGDRFRIVSVPDINLENLHLAPKTLQQLSFLGPKLLGVRLSTGADADFKDSIIQSLNGEPPAFRPARWVPYKTQVNDIIETAKPMEKLLEKYPDQKNTLEKIAIKNQLRLDEMGYLPLLADGELEWTIILGLVDGTPKAYLQLSAWD